MQITSQESGDNKTEPRTRSKITGLSILQSVVAGFFGIQKDSNRVRDFESGKFWHFFVAGGIFVIVFMLLVYGAVRYLIATS